MQSNIEKQLIDFVQTVTTDTSIDQTTDLVQNNWLDSLLLMDLVILVENEMNVKLDGDDVSPENFRTIENLSRLIAERFSGDPTEGNVAA